MQREEDSHGKIKRGGDGDPNLSYRKRLVDQSKRMSVYFYSSPMAAGEGFEKVNVEEQLLKEKTQEDLPSKSGTLVTMGLVLGHHNGYEVQISMISAGGIIAIFERFGCFFWWYMYMYT